MCVPEIMVADNCIKKNMYLYRLYCISCGEIGVVQTCSDVVTITVKKRGTTNQEFHKVEVQKKKLPLTIVYLIHSCQKRAHDHVE